MDKKTTAPHCPFWGGATLPPFSYVGRMIPESRDREVAWLPLPLPSTLSETVRNTKESAACPPASAVPHTAPSWPLRRLHAKIAAVFVGLSIKLYDRLVP